MNIKTRLRKAVLFPFLLPVFFVLHTQRNVYGAIPLDAIIQVVLLYTGLTALLFLAARRGLRYAPGAGLAALLLMVLFIYWGEIVRLSNDLLHTQNYLHLPVLLLLWLALTAWAAWFLKTREAALRNRITLFLNLLLLLYVTVELALIAQMYWRAAAGRPAMAQTSLQIDQHIDTVAAPGIYLLLFDEYAATASLREEWGYNNAYMDSALLRRHFKVNTNSCSNYQWTYFSMASMLNMDYLDTAFEQKDFSYADYPESFKWIAKARIVTLLRSAGYSFYNRSIFDVAGQPKPFLNELLVSSRELLTINNLYQTAAHYYIPYLKNRQAARHDPGYHNPYFYRFDDYNKQRVQEVMALSSRPSDRPRFIYAHFLMPHYPYYYDSRGNYLPPHIAERALQASSPVPYCNNVAHTNRELLRLVDTILKNEQGKAIILVMGDHGYRTDAKPKNKMAPFRNFSAFYYPDGDYKAIPDTLTNVNVFRIVCNKVLGTTYPLLQNRSVHLHSAQDHSLRIR